MPSSIHTLPSSHLIVILKTMIMDTSSWQITTFDGKVVWRGAKDKHPSAKVLNEILSHDVTAEQLVDYTIQVVRGCPPRALPNMLSYLACTCWASQGSVNIKRLFTLANANKRSLCGKPVKKGDIMWICRQCGKDPTCVQCDDCFQNSDHEGHEVYFYRSSASGGGGCCDCGDPEAWQDCGNCCNHGADRASKSIDPVSVIPAELLTTLDPVITGVLLIILNVITTEVNGFLPPSLSGSTFFSENMAIRLHNDDLHSFDDVTTALISTGLTQAEAAPLTMAVDQDGSATILKTYNRPEAQRLWNLLGTQASLLLSVVPTSVAALDENVSVAWAWLMQLAGSNDGLMRHITVRLLENTGKLCALAGGEGGDTDEDMLPVSSSTATSTHGTTLLRRHLPGPLLSYPPHLPLRPGGTHPDPPPAHGARDGHRGLMIVPPGSDGAASKGLTLVSSLTPFGPSPSGASDTESEETKGGVAYTPHVMLAVLLACSPYLCKGIQKGLHDAVILMQQDALFKSSFSQLLVHVYPTLSVLFFHGIGTQYDTIFTSSVQVFTSDSVVKTMSAEGVDSRPVSISPCTDGRKPITIISTLTSSLLVAFQNMNVDACRQNDDFLQDFIIKNRRMFHICRDLEYITGCVDQVKDFFNYIDSQDRRPVLLTSMHRSHCICPTARL